MNTSAIEKHFSEAYGPDSLRMGPLLSLLIRHLPQSVDTALRRWCYPAVLLAKSTRVCVARIRGATRFGQASVFVAGPEPWASDLPRRMFRGSPQQSPAGETPVWKADAVFRELAEHADLVVARVDTLSSRLFFDCCYLRVPEWVDTILFVPDDLDALVRSNHSLREDMRVVRHSGLTASISRSEEDFEEFYSSMYLPFVRGRHGALAWPSNRESLFKCFRRGGLIWLMQADERVAAILFEQVGDVLHLPAEGTRNGDVSVLKNGVVSALFFHAIRHAIECGCRVVDFGGCRPCLSDGVLRYKRKWGMEVRVRPRNQFYTLIRWRRWNAAVAAFLSDVPVLHQNGCGLSAITSAGLPQPGVQADVDRICHAVHFRGLKQITIVNEAGWAPGVAPPPSCVLVAGTPLPEQVIPA